MTSNRAELDELGEEYQRLAASIHCTCTGCGTEIDLERLRARPGAARCLACQERFERMHATPGGARSS